MDAIPLQRLKDQLLIVLIKRLGGKVDLPVSEVDDTGQDIMELRIIDNKEFGPSFDGHIFQLQIKKKS